MAQTGKDMATTIFDIAHQCLDSFEQLAAKQDESILTHPFVPGDGNGTSKSGSHSSRDFLGLRNSFSFWIDYTGALSLMDSSLDTRLRGLTDISSMVIELLEMVLRNLQRREFDVSIDSSILHPGFLRTDCLRNLSVCLVDRKAGDPSIGSSDLTTSDSKELQAVISRWEDASRAVDFALDRLHFLAAAIRKASAKQLEYNVATFLTDDDIVFRRDAASLVRWKFPSARKRLCEQLGDSIAVRRRMLLQKHRHAMKLTARRVVETAPSAKQSQDSEPKSMPTASPPAKDRIMRHLNVPASGVTKASMPDPQAPVLRHLHLPQRPALTSVISTISTAPGDSFEYPPPPKIKEGETRIQCPYCLMPLDFGELENRGNQYWRHHVDEDLKSYVCMFPECAEALVFFTRRHEWKSHMESVHSIDSIDWPRKVHTIIWYCDIDHDPPERFETELQWREHMKNLDSHPRRQLTEPTKAQLDALSPRKQQVALRERFVCPLCEHIPEKIRPLAEKGKGNPAEMYEFLVDHVANHIKSLSLISLPCLDNTPAPLDTDGESIAIKDSFRRLMDQGSVPQPPSGIEYLDGVSLPPEVWSTLDRDNIAALITLDLEWAWDKEYPNYVHPDDPPELLDDEWVETWNIWKEKSDPFTQESVDLDPVIAHLKNAKISVDAAQATAHTITLKDSELETLLDEHARELDKAKQELLEQQWADVMITEEVVKAAARNGESGKEVMMLLLRKRGSEIKITEEVVWAAAGNEKSGKEVISLLLQERGSEIKITEKVVWAAAGNEKSGKEVISLLLQERGSEIKITEEVVRAAARNEKSGKEVISLLLQERGSEIKITEEVVQAAAGNEKSGKEVISLLLQERGNEIKITEEVVRAAARNEKSGKEVISLLLQERGSEIKITEEVVRAAARNEKSGKDVISLLLQERGSEIKITKEVVKAAVGNRESGKEMMMLLLEQRGHDIVITEAVVKAAAGNGESGKKVMMLLLDRRGADIVITEEVVKAAVGNRESGMEVMMLLLNRREHDIVITEEMVKVVAENGESGKEVMMLLLDRRGHDIVITEEVVKTAAGMERAGRK